MNKLVKYYKGDLIEYNILKLVDFYNEILRKPTTPWEHKQFDPKESEYLAFSLAETLKVLGGLGLSANQVGLPHRVCVINMGESGIWTMFNPQIIEHGEKLSQYSEGCLSYPGLYVKVPRYDHIKVKFQAIYGQEVEQEFDGLTAVCIQHEIDHLDGVVYTDRISPIKLDQAKRKVKKNLKKMKAITQTQELVDVSKEQQIDQPKSENTIEKFVYSTG
jgi:peptide deformylase